MLLPCPVQLTTWGNVPTQGRSLVGSLFVSLNFLISTTALTGERGWFCFCNPGILLCNPPPTVMVCTRS